MNVPAMMTNPIDIGQCDQSDSMVGLAQNLEHEYLDFTQEIDQ